MYNPDLRPEKMSQFGIYIHIPFCIQQCGYCDFATELKTSEDDIQSYVDVLCTEINTKKPLTTDLNPTTIYFGGGTPSLLSGKQLAQIILALKSVCSLEEVTEFTIEANPATINQEKLHQFTSLGVNRFSLGAQTFDDNHLKNIGRRHKSADTIATMELFSKNNINYSMDLLYTLPNQRHKQLKEDLKIIFEFSPSHISAYLLTLKQGHPMNRDRPTDDEQNKMFLVVDNFLLDQGYHRYEISNYAKPQRESKHNQTYWNFSNYLSFGRSAHSFLFPHKGWGIRFWNPYSRKSYNDYVEELSKAKTFQDTLLKNHFEHLNKNESLTDFCYTALRTSNGLDLNKIAKTFGNKERDKVSKALARADSNKLVKSKNGLYTLTQSGVILSNQVFADLVFS